MTQDAAADEFTCDLDAFLWEAMMRPNFRRYFDRAQRKAEQGHLASPPTKPSLRRRGWRRA